MNDNENRAAKTAAGSAGADTQREAAAAAGGDATRNTESRSVTIRVSSPRNPLSSPSFWIGAAAILLGVLVTVLPLAWDAAARMVEPLGDARVHSVSLVIGGLLILTLGGHSDNLVRIRRVIESMGNELTRLEQLAFENRRQSAALQNVQVGHKDVKDEVHKLRQAVEHLSELAAQQEQAKAMVKLAGSVDQVRARLEASVKEQLGALQKHMDQGLESVERATCGAASTLSSSLSSTLSSTLGELETSLTEQQQSQRLALREGLEEVTSQQEALKRGLDQATAVVVGLQRDSSEQRGELQRLAEAVVREPRAVAEQMSEAVRALAERSEQQAQAQLERGDEHARDLAAALTNIEASLAPKMEALGERVADELGAQRRVVLEQSAALRKALEANADAQTQWAKQFDTSLSTQLGEQRAAAEKLIGAASARAVEATQASSAALSTSMERVGMRLESQSAEQVQQLAQRIEQSMDAMTARAVEATQASSAALSTSVERLGMRLEAQSAEQGQQLAQRLEQSMDTLTARAVEATQSAGSTLVSNLEHLASLLERQPQAPNAAVLVHALEHALGQAMARVIGATRQANAQLASDLERLGAQVVAQRVDKGEDAQVAALDAALMASAEVDRFQGLLDHRLRAHESAMREALTQNGELVLNASIEISATADRLAAALSSGVGDGSRAPSPAAPGASIAPDADRVSAEIAAPLPFSRQG